MMKRLPTSPYLQTLNLFNTGFFCPPGEANVVVVNISKFWVYAFIDHIFILLARSSPNELHLCNSAGSEDVAGMFL